MTKLTQTDWRGYCRVVLAKAKKENVDWYPRIGDKFEAICDSNGPVTKEQIDAVIEETKALIGAWEVKEDE